MRRKLVVLAALMLVASCGSPAPEPERTSKTFEGIGRIVSVEESTVLIDHGEIPGFMDAMTMSFPVTDPDLLRELEPGMKVSFRIVVEGNSYAIDEVSPR